MISNASGKHLPVLAEPFVQALCIDPDGRYIDATFGRGGHTSLLLAKLSAKGRILAIDRDPAAVQAGERLAMSDARLTIRHASFADLRALAAQLAWDHVQGIGFDLGVSSPQLDDASRGFSFREAGPLDMRMDPTQGRPLSEKLKRVREHELVRILRQYGGERFAARIAKAILQRLHEGRLNTTRDLEDACFHAVPRSHRYGRIHPATRTFQALRIWVNDEFHQLRLGLEAAFDLLAPKGRLAVIAFHSGEDRLVRDLIEAEVKGCQCPPSLPKCICGKSPRMRWVVKKPIRPTEEEIHRNPRARSARLRVAERLP